MDELQTVVRSLNPNHIPGLDGFNGAFYRATWSTIANDLLAIVNNFLRSGRLLAQVNHTLLCLVPKMPIPASVDNYCPITLCNVLYRIISKILANRLKPLLPNLIDFNQSAFINGRRITDSILLAHELCHNLHTSQGQARMCLKLDLCKAFDTLNRHFLCNTPQCLGFHDKWVGWIQECMSPTFSLLINGECSAPFHSSNGVHQGDPISPYLSVIAMQVLSALLCKVESKHELNPISYGSLLVSHIIVADDLMIFLKDDKKNARHLKLVLDEFTALLASPSTSTRAPSTLVGL